MIYKLKNSNKNKSETLTLHCLFALSFFLLFMGTIRPIQAAEQLQQVNNLSQNNIGSDTAEIIIPLKTDKGQRRKIKINADTAHYNVKQGFIRYQGNARLEEDRFTLNADTITAYTQNKQITNVVITGLDHQDVTFSHFPEDRTQKPLFGRGQVISYQPGYDIINIDGHARIDHDGSYVMGQNIEYSIDPSTPAIISGSARLKQQDDNSIVTLASDRIIAFFNVETKKVVQTIASNHTQKPVILEYTPLPPSEEKPAYGEALIIEYFVEEKLLKMKNNALLIRDGSLIEGDQIHYQTVQDKILASSLPLADSAAKKQVKFILPPEEKEPIKK